MIRIGVFQFFVFVPSAGLEPATLWFEAKYSIQLSYEGFDLHSTPVSRKEEGGI